MSLLLLPAALLMGGWRDPMLFAAGGAAVWAAVWMEGPQLGPAAAWLPWLGWAALAGLAGAQPAAALAPLARWAAALAFFSLAAAWDERARELWVKSVLAAAVVLAAAALISGVGQGYAQFMLGLLPPYYNYTAFALAAAAAAAAAWALHPRGPRGAWRAAALAVSALSAFCVVLSTSRGGTLGLAVAAAVWSLRRWGRRAAAVGALAALAAFGAWRAAAMLPAVRARVEARALKTYRPYSEVRPQIWRASVLIADERPWFGEGPGAYVVGFRRHPARAQGGASLWGNWTEYAHSEFLQAAAETGWAGSSLWLVGFGALLSVLAAPADTEPAREAAAAALAAMSVQVCVDSMLQLPALAFLFFSAGALAGARPRGGRRLPRAAAVLGAALALGAGLPRALARDPARAAVLFPADPLAREDLAYRAEKQGRLAEADALWTQAAARAPFDAIYPWRRAQIAAAEGRWTDAERLAAQATALEPGFLNARVLRARALIGLGRRASARVELNEVRRLRAQPLGYVYTGYDVAVSTLDAAEFSRVQALSGAAR